MGRLTFYLANGRHDSALQLDTKSWNTIESIEGTLTPYASVRGLVFDLTVQIVSKGDKRYPVLLLGESNVQINNDEDVAKADALIALTKAVENGQARSGLATFLDAVYPGWRDDAARIAWVTEQGPEKAARILIARNQ
jgi:hypothetical protein